MWVIIDVDHHLTNKEILNFINEKQIDINSDDKVFLELKCISSITDMFIFS